MHMGVKARVCKEFLCKLKMLWSNVKENNSILLNSHHYQKISNTSMNFLLRIF